MDVDRIEREVVIDAPVERVWELVAQPGWWIGGADGDVSGQRRSREGELEIIEDPRYGRFAVRVEMVDPPRYVAYRGAPVQAGSAAELGAGKSTLVEFWVAETPGGVSVRVVESGFSGLELTEEQRRGAVEGNVEGWRIMMGVLGARARARAAG